MRRELETITFPGGASFDVPKKFFDKVVSDLIAENKIEMSAAQKVAHAKFLHFYREMIRIMSIEHQELLCRVRDLITTGIRDGIHLQPTMSRLMNLIGGIGDCEDVNMVSMFLSRVVEERTFIDVPDLEQVINDNRVMGEYLLRPYTMCDFNWRRIE